ncbi:FAD/NAD(P)-binding protein [Enterococcus sp. DIV1298c]|uniref:FAD/NAD(P)-binding protein n=1 Tax=Enterococcus sp. DIV1298c TaxID=2815328 RepID=UPI001A93930C|nr:FAD/NAD(P)-binding domain-containing protein [Enterococcus sp. DIV1298c]MBO0461290.1 FAD/NAD(P)-binding protein [Enterococcus sp. DIV1298c]
MRIGIIGAGPRGLSMLERLLYNNQQEKEIEILLFDLSGIGGKVWRVDQPKEVLMNSLASQVTMFTDETLSSGGVVANGINLYQWAKELAPSYLEKTNIKEKEVFLREAADLSENQPTSRRFFGAYLQWFYEELQERFPDRFDYVQQLVTEVTKKDTRYVVETIEETYVVDQLILATGHWEHEFTTEENQLSGYAAAHDLFYQGPANPADVDLSMIPAKEPVFIRGLGLCFFDYIGLLTQQRGGRFVEQGGKLVYLPSGEEPIVYCGSRRGFPYYPHGRNQKKVGEVAKPVILTQERLETYYRTKKLSGQDFFAELKKELELFYYKKVIEERGLAISLSEFQEVFLVSSENEWLQQYPELSHDLWSWDLLDHLTDHTLPYPEMSRKYIEDQISEAQKGNVDGPLIATLDALKDWRNLVHQVMLWEVFSAKEYKEVLWQWFNTFDAFFTIGPPLRRTQELAALIDAGIFRLVEPPFTIAGKNGHFCLEDRELTFDYLIEARLPKNDLQTTSNPVLKNLREKQILQPFQLHDSSGEYVSGAVAVERSSSRVIDANGEVQNNLFCIGIPTEGVEWLTASVPRPHVDFWNLKQIDHIAQLILAEEA